MNGKYLTPSGTGSVLHADSDSIGPDQQFQMILDLTDSDRIVALKAFNGKYVSSQFMSNQQDDAMLLAANSDTINTTEYFRIDDWGDRNVAIFAPNQRYIILMQADATFKAIGDEASASRFKIVKLDSKGVPVPDAAQVIIVSPASNPSALSARDAVPLDVLTVCFCGTACTRDEGEISREGSPMEIYAPATGYIPVRIHREISGDLHATTPSVTIRGVGQNDWTGNDIGETLISAGPLNAPPSLLRYIDSYLSGNQNSMMVQVNGWSAPALALHAANVCAASGKKQYNFIGHSRGAVEAIMAAWFLYAYGSDDVKNIPVNIFAIDPVPGVGEWYGIFTQLPPNVVNYVGIYSWDMCYQPNDAPFMPVVPRPNGLMSGKDNKPAIYQSWWKNEWKYIADTTTLTDPLMASSDRQPSGYELYACRGRHSTLAGNYTAKAVYEADDTSQNTLPVPELIYKMARAYLTRWGTTFAVASAVQGRVLALRQAININHRDFDLMGGGETRTSALALRPYVRRVSSISGMNPYDSYYFDNVAGNPPYKMAYPVTSERQDAGWVNWKFL